MGILLLKLGKLADFLEQLDAAEGYLRDAEKILRITHSEASAIYRESLLPLLMNFK